MAVAIQGNAQARESSVQTRHSASPTKASSETDKRRRSESVPSAKERRFALVGERDFSSELNHGQVDTHISAAKGHVSFSAAKDCDCVSITEGQISGRSRNLTTRYSSSTDRDTTTTTQQGKEQGLHERTGQVCQSGQNEYDTDVLVVFFS